MKMELVWTHYVVERGQITLFNLDECENCGCATEGPNSITCLEPESRLKDLGLTKVSKRLPDLGYCDALGMATCPSCYKEEE